MAKQYETFLINDNSGGTIYHCGGILGVLQPIFDDENLAYSGYVYSELLSFDHGAVLHNSGVKGRYKVPGAVCIKPFNAKNVLKRL